MVPGFSWNDGCADTFSLLPLAYALQLKLEGVSGDLQKVAKEGYSFKNVLSSFVHLHLCSCAVKIS